MNQTKTLRLVGVLALAIQAMAQTAAVSNVTVSYSATPVFTATAPVTNFDITLTGNVSSSTFAAPAVAVGSLRVCQDSTGGRTFAAPTGSVGFGAIDATASKCSVAEWKWDGTTLRGTSPFTKDDGTVVSGGSGSGTVTSVTVAGTANQISITGTCTGTTAISCTLSIPSTLQLPGTINKITLTQPATGATITVLDGKVLTVSNSLTLTATDGSSVAFGAGGTVVYSTDPRLSDARTPGAFPPCAGTPGNTTGAYKSFCVVPSTGALWACVNNPTCAVAADWAAGGGGGGGASYPGVAADGNSGLTIDGSVATGAGGPTIITTGCSYIVLADVPGGMALAAANYVLPAVSTTTTATASSGATAITVASATGIGWGQLISGVNIAAGTRVTLISGTTITLSAAVTGDLSATSVTFSSPQGEERKVCDGISGADLTTGGGTNGHWAYSTGAAWIAEQTTGPSGVSSGTAPIVYNSGTGAVSCPLCVRSDVASTLTNPDLGGTALSNTVTAGTGGVTAGHIVEKTTDNPTTYVNATSATSQIKGIARTTVSAAATFQVVTTGFSGCVVEGAVTAGNYWTKGSTDKSKCKDTGISSFSSISNAIRTGGVFQASGTDGQTVNVSVLQNSSGGQIDTLTANAATALSTTCAGTVNWAVAHPAGDTATITTTGACNLTVSGMASGAYYSAFVTQGSGGSHTLTLGTGGTGGCAAWKVGNNGAGAVTITAAAGSIDALVWYYNGTNCYVSTIPNFN